MSKNLKEQLDEILEISNMLSDMDLPMKTEDFVAKLFEGKSLEEIHNMDPIAEWEKVNNVSYKNNNELSNLSMIDFVAKFNEQKKKLLLQAKETHNGMDFEEFVNLMLQMGFKVGFKQEFKKDKMLRNNETEVILYDEECGFIIYANSFSKMLNVAVLYGELEPSGYVYQEGDENRYTEIAKEVNNYNYLSSFGLVNKPLKQFIENSAMFYACPVQSIHGRVKNSSNIAFNFDMREGAVFKINKLRTDHTFAKPAKHWVEKDKWLRLQNYTPKESRMDIDKVINKKLLSCPQEVLDIINDPARFNKRKNNEDQTGI